MSDRRASAITGKTRVSPNAARRCKWHEDEPNIRLSVIPSPTILSKAQSLAFQVFVRQPVTPLGHFSIIRFLFTRPIVLWRCSSSW